jgi:tetratricopeptide (TPR) repeat protein
LLAGQGRREEARTEYELARELQKRIVADFPANPQNQSDLAGTHRRLGLLLKDLEQSGAARTELELARDLQQKLADAFPALPRYQNDLAATHYTLGLLLSELAQRDAARAEYELARDLQQKLADAFPAVPAYQANLAATHNSLGLALVGLGQRDAARKAFETSINLRQKLVVAFPAVPPYQVDLGGSYVNYGQLVRNEGRPADSLHWFDLAIRAITPVYEQDRRAVTTRQFVCNGHSGRAVAYDLLKRHTEAIEDWNKAIELDPGREQPRVGRAISRMQAGKTAEAVAEVEELTNKSNWSAGAWYSFASVYSVASSQISDHEREYADRAMELLRQAVHAGYKNAVQLAKDVRLDSLRQREDFQKLLAELQTRNQ